MHNSIQNPEEINRDCQVLHPLKIRSCIYVTKCGFESQHAGTASESWCPSILHQALAVARPEEFSCNKYCMKW